MRFDSQAKPRQSLVTIITTGVSVESALVTLLASVVRLTAKILNGNAFEFIRIAGTSERLGWMTSTVVGCETKQRLDLDLKASETSFLWDQIQLGSEDQSDRWVSALRPSSSPIMDSFVDSYFGLWIGDRYSQNSICVAHNSLCTSGKLNFAHFYSPDNQCYLSQVTISAAISCATLVYGLRQMRFRAKNAIELS